MTQTREPAPLTRSPAAERLEAAGLNFFDVDPNLAFSLRRLCSGAEYGRALPLLHSVGEIAGGEVEALAREADRHPPELRQYDARGNRVDEVLYHASYRAMEEIAFGRLGFAAMSHRPGVLGWPGSVPHWLKYALSYLFVQAEFGLFCPVSMTDSLARVLRLFGDRELKETFLLRLTATEMPALLQGAMFLTEKQGGSDVGLTETRALREGDTWRLWGDKWFCSNVSAGLILTLARPDGAPDGTRGLGLFLVPRALPDGRRNSYRINRLKEKLGTRDMATGEVTFDGATAFQVGALERGFRQMAEMINVSRLSNAMRAAALMRRGLLESLTYARARRAFGRRLIDLPLMRVTLLDMLVDVEAALALVLDGAVSLDRADAGAERDATLIRLLTPLAKACLTRRARAVTGEALEVRGGNGYVEDWVEPRLLRDSHLGSVWEGSTNVVALDVLRAMTRESAGEVFFGDTERRLRALQAPAVRPLAALTGVIVAAAEERVRLALGGSDGVRETGARRLVTHMADVRMAALLLEEAEAQLVGQGSYRKLLVAAAYTARHLIHDERAQAAVDAAADAWLTAVVEWEQIPLEAILPLTGALRQEAT